MCVCVCVCAELHVRVCASAHMLCVYCVYWLKLSFSFVKCVLQCSAVEPPGHPHTRRVSRL